MSSKSVTGYAPSEPGAEGGELFDLRVVWLVLRRRWRLLLAALLACLALGVIVTAVQTPAYQATATVAIDLRTQEVVKSDQVLSNLPEQKDVADTEVELLRSPRLAQAVVRNLSLDKVPELNGTAPPHGLAALKAAIASLAGGKSDAPTTPTEMFDNAVGTVVSHVQIDRRGLTYVIDIRYTDDDPEQAARIANGYARAYLGSQRNDKVEANEEATKWLQDRVNNLRGEVTGAERSVAQYQGQQGLLVATGSALTEQRVAQLQQEENTARADLAEKQARLGTARKQLAGGSTGEDLGVALSSPVIQALRNQIAIAEQTQSQLLTRYGPKHPDVINSQHTISQLQQQIKDEVRRIIGSLESDVTVSQSRLSTIDGSLGAARGTLARDKTAQVGLNELDRNAQAKRSLYQTYLDRLQQTSTQAGLAHADASLVATAQPPGVPSTPNVKLNILLALLAGVSLGLALVTLLEFLNQSLQTSTQVEQKLGEPCAGSVPLLKRGDGAPIDHILNKPLSVFSESFRKLRVFLQHGDPSGPVKVLAVTSALPKEGKTTTSFCFARSLAQSGLRVVVVDCDTRVRSLSRMAKLDRDQDLVGVLSGEVALADALTVDEASGASILPLGRAEQTPKDLLGSPAMDALLARLRSEFDFVILDCPPALAVSDALSVAHKADGVLFLVRWGSTSSRAADYALAALRSAEAKVLGVALTQVDMRAQSRFGYGDSGYFYKQYSQYYTE